MKKENISKVLSYGTLFTLFLSLLTLVIFGLTDGFMDIVHFVENLDVWMGPNFLSPSGDLGIGLVWDNPTPPHPTPDRLFGLTVEILFKLNLII